MINSRDLHNKLLSFLLSVKRSFAHKLKKTVSLRSSYSYIEHPVGCKSRRSGRPSLLLRPLLIAASALMLFSLSSCGSQLPRLSKDKPVMITIWHHYLGEQKVSFDSLIAEFNNTIGADSGITVKAFSMDNTGDIHARLLASANREPGSSDFPEIATAYPSTAYTLYSMGKLIPFDKYMTKEELGEYVPSFIEEGRLTEDSGCVIFPIAKSTETLYINYTFYKQFLDEYNKANPSKKLNEDMLKTFEGIRETAAAYFEWTDAKTPEIPNDGKALYGCDAVSNFAIISYKQLGSDFFIVNSDNTGEIDLNNPAMKTIWDSYFVPRVKGHFGAYSFYRSEDTQTGDLLMYVGSSAGASFFPKTVTFPDNTKYDIELKVMPYPSFENSKKIAVQQGAGAIISKSTPEKEYASVVFLKWLTEPERNIDFVLKTGYLPVKNKAFEILRQKLPEYRSGDMNENVVKVLECTLEMMDTHELYTYKPFKASDDIRYSFEDKLISFTQAARNEFVEALPDDVSVDRFADEYITDRLFEQFLTEVRHEVLKAE
jgi:multiple sugar transport system substrate-binding protein